MKLFCTLVLIFITGITFSQEFEISGKVVDEEGTPLGSATIYAEKIADSSLVNYTISGSDGTFSFEGETEEDSIALAVSYTGLQPYREIMRVREQMQLDPIVLTVADNELDEVLVTATRSPITLKRDTLEFNAQSFQTRPDANLEDLLEQLPGVEVDTEGNITVNGRPVSRFLVNGEEFFGSDHRIATKNLPKEIIEKIQVTDTKTEEQEFTGEAGDPDNKTVNITIQEDQNKGYFARATAGGGTDERYEMSGIANYFKDEFRISALASSNNINSSGFSYDEVYGMMGRSAGRSVFGGGGGGITKSETAGLNFVNEWNDMENWEEIELTGDYFFGRNDTERRTAVSREYITGDFRNSEDRSNLVNDSHRANLDFEIEFDTLSRLSITPRFNANYGTSNRSGMAESLNSEGDLVNNTETYQNEDLVREDFSNEIDYIRRFGARGAFLKGEFSNDHNRQRNDNFYYSESRFFGEEERVEIQDQYIDEDENEDRYSLELDQRSVLADQLFLDVSYDLDYEFSTNKRYVYEADNGDGNYDDLNTLLSNDFEVLSTRHTPRAGLNYDGDLWRIDTEVGLHHTTLENENFLEETAFDNTYNNLLLDARVRYEVERSREISVRYSTNVDIPNINQLQPVVDRTNPLHIRQGNPGLRPTYRQDIDLDFRNFDYATRTGYYTWIDFSTTQNEVVSVTTVGEDLVRNTTYTNIDGAMRAGAGASYHKQIKDGATEFRYNVRLSGSYNRNIGYINLQESPEPVRYEADRFSVNPRIRFTYAIDELFEINPSYSLDYNSSSYDITTNRDEEVTNHRLGLRVTSYWPENVVFGNDINYNYFGQVAPGFDNTAILWNMSLGYQFLDDDATVKVQVYDLLDQNVDTRRTIGDDYIQDTQSLILTRYAMLSFTYKINNIGGRPGSRRGR